jgi:hypothetical protein
MVDDKLQEHRISASLRCPGCGHELECTLVHILQHFSWVRGQNYISLVMFIFGFMSRGCCHKDMAGFPAGIKFDPTDQELIEHLESKVMDGGSRAHPLIDDFIPTLQGEDGICYTHPEKLPGE